MRLGDACRQQGAALAYVLALLAIVGVLVGLVWRIIRSDNAIAAMDGGNAQARFLALAGVEYALAKIGSPGGSRDLAYAVEDLKYSLGGAKQGFDLTVRTHGLCARVLSIGRTELPLPGYSRKYSALLGQSIDLARLPALGILEPDGGLVLAGKAQVSGAVMLWREKVKRATNPTVRLTGSGHSGAIWDSSSSAWGLVGLDFSRADAWIEAQQAILSGHGFDGDSDFDSGRIQEVEVSDRGMVDTTLSKARITAPRLLRVGSGARLIGCKLISPRIVIEDGAFVKQTLAYASRTIDIRGGGIEGGQFLAGDSVRISSETPFKGYPLFYAQGRMVNRGKSDSALVGALMLEKASGEGLFISACRHHPADDWEVRLSVSPAVRITGLLYTPCHARMEGTLRGSLICRNLTFEYGGTIWNGHLKDAHLDAFSGRKVIPGPLLFPGFPAQAFATGYP